MYAAAAPPPPLNEPETLTPHALPAAEVLLHDYYDEDLNRPAASVGSPGAPPRAPKPDPRC